jgi:hypothetical protein
MLTEDAYAAFLQRMREQILHNQKSMKTILRLLPLLFLIVLSTAHAQSNLYVSVDG